MIEEEDDDDFVYFQDFFNAAKAGGFYETESVAEVVRAELKNHPAAERIWLAATWLITHSPEIGKELPNTAPARRLLKLMPNEIAKTPGLLVRYYMDGNRVAIDWVKFFPYDKAKSVSPAAYVYSKK